MFLSPVAAVAEVMDKEPTLPVLFGWTAIFLLPALLLARLNAWATLLVLPFSAVYAFGTAGELLDDQIGPAILREGGWAYVAPAILSVAINLIAPPAVALWCANRRRQPRQVRDEPASRGI